MKKYPFKFLDSYTRKDLDIFFGREDEVDSLYEMVFQSPIIVIYGVSGTGKTSLIQCGLANKFKPYDWLALFVRRGMNLNSSLNKALCEAGEYEELKEENEVSAKSEVIINLKEKIEAAYLHSFLPIYLIFDQFEELYVLGSKAEQTQFIQVVKEILTVDQPVKMIFVIREEYLGYLYEFEKEVPELMNKKLRVEAMNQDKVRQVIKGVSGHKMSNVSIQEGEGDIIAEGIFNKIKGKEKTLTIQLPYLQVFLDKLYLNITNDKTRVKDAVITSEALGTIGDIGDVMIDFLEEQARDIRSNLSAIHGYVPLEDIWKILSHFATLEGTKEPIKKDYLYDQLTGMKPELIDAAVDAFVASRILRYSENEELFEITHDSLAKRIASKRSEDDIALEEIRRLIKSQSTLIGEASELFSEKQLNFIDPFLGRIKLTPDEQDLIDNSRNRIKAEINKAKNRLRLLSFLLVIALGGVIFALIGLKNAKRDRINLGLIDYVNDLASAQIISDEGKNAARLSKLKNDIVGDDDIDNNEAVLTFLIDSSILKMHEDDAIPYNRLSLQALLKLDTLFSAMDESEDKQKEVLESVRSLLNNPNFKNDRNSSGNFLQLPYVYYTLEEYHKAIVKITKVNDYKVAEKASIISVVASNPKIPAQYAYGNALGQVFLEQNIRSQSEIANLNYKITAITYSPNAEYIYVSTTLGEIYEIIVEPKEGTEHTARLVYSNYNNIIYLESLPSRGLLLVGTTSKIDVLKQSGENYKLIHSLNVMSYFGKGEINMINATPHASHILIGGTNHSAILSLTPDNKLNILEHISHQGVNISAVSLTISQDSSSTSQPKLRVALGSEVGELWIDLDHQLALDNDLLSNAHYQKLLAHTASITDIEYNTYSPQLATSSLDGTIRLWNLEMLDSDFDHIRLEYTGQGFSSLTYINEDDLVSTRNNYHKIWKTSVQTIADDLILSLNQLSNKSQLRNNNK